MIHLLNCNNIDEGNISVEKNHLNIKYAFNGTGKSTISTAIRATIENDNPSLQDLTPFKYIGDEENTPKVEGLEDYSSVKIFNEEYVNQYVFQSDELIKNSFDIFIKSEKYDQHINNINDLVKQIHETFQNDDELRIFINALKNFLDSYGKTKTGYAKSSIIGKGLGTGNKLNNIPMEIAQYSPFLQKSEINVKWLKWQQDGKQYIGDEDICPFCTKDISKEKELINKISENFDSKEIDALNKILELFESFYLYLSDEANEKINEISFNITGITTEQKQFLSEVRDQVQTLYNNMMRLNNIGFISLNRADSKVVETIKEYKTDIKYLSHLNSDFVSEKIDKINKSIDDVLDKVGKIQGEVAQQQNLIKNTIDKYNSEINTFLETAGYKYKVDIIGEGEDYKLKLFHIDYQNEISETAQHLSYGEKNAFALALFMYSVLNENPDLVILDDPISSFDGNKKFAIINMLFMGSNSLKDRTVLLFTHEFNIVIDTIYNFRGKIEPSPVAYFLSTKNGNLNETLIEKEDIKSFVKIANDKFNSSIDIINKAVYLRRLVELNEEKGLSWNLLSSLFHKRDIPTILSEGNRDMTTDEVADAENEVRTHISGFDYSEQLLRVKDTETIKSLYFNCTCNYEKLQLFRILFDHISLDDVMKKYINETYHIENDYLFQLDPEKYETIPSYIIDKCDELTSTFIKKTIKN